MINIKLLLAIMPSIIGFGLMYARRTYSLPKVDEQAVRTRIQPILTYYEKERQQFENNPLWKQLNTTPQEFLAQINQQIESLPHGAVLCEKFSQELNQLRERYQLSITNALKSSTLEEYQIQSPFAYSAVQSPWSNLTTMRDMHV